MQISRGVYDNFDGLSQLVSKLVGDHKTYFRLNLLQHLLKYAQMHLKDLRQTAAAEGTSMPGKHFAAAGHSAKLRIHALMLLPQVTYALAADPWAQTPAWSRGSRQPTKS